MNAGFSGGVHFSATVLLELHIESFAIIDTLHVQFSEGLNIVTGETGAGKSIMVDALTVALGGRAYAEFIRSGAEKAVVEALFSLRGQEDVKAKAAEYGFLDPAQEDYELLIRREIARNGRNRLLMNGHPATNVMVAEIGNLLVDVHGQHEHQYIFNTDYHVDLLDSFGKLMPLRERVSAAYRQFKQCERELDELRNRTRERMQHLDMLRFQQQDIAKAKLQPGEEDALMHERKVLSGAGQLSTGAGKIYETLYGERGSLLETMNEIYRQLEEMTSIDETLDVHLKACKSVQYQLEDLAYSMRDYAQTIEFDPYRLEEVAQRLDVIKKLKRKYGSTVEEILEFLRNVDEELTAFDESEIHITRLEKQYETLRDQVRTFSEELSAERRRVAEDFSQQVIEELAVLGMEKTLFEVDMQPAGTESHPFTAKGIDKIEFLIAPNPGEPPKALTKIASGGEISRIMLALKTLLGTVDRVPTMVFDEIDTGIGGKIAEIVGKKLQHISESHQVVCITHLPQIASKGITHFHVDKEMDIDSTTTVVHRLSGPERLEEIARMLGGETLTPITLQHAKEMLDQALMDGR